MQPRPRILHVIPSVARQDGGPSRAIALIERALAGDDIAFELATTDDDGPGRRLPGPFTRDGEPIGGFRATRFFAKRTDFYKISPALACWLSRHVRDYDLVHIHALFSFSSIAAAWIARRAGVPYIVRPLGTLNHYGVSQRRPWLKRLSLRWIEGPILRDASAVHFTAEAEREEADALRITMRGVVIPLAVEDPVEPDLATWYARYPALASRRSVLFLSRIDPKKNLEAVLDAFALQIDLHPDVMLVVAGDGEARYVADLKQRAQRLGLAERVVWTGFIDGGLKSAALQCASVFLLPSHSENFGIAAAEALASALPCVLGKGVAIAQDVEAAEAGMAIEPTAAATSVALSRYLGDEAARLHSAAAARRFAKEQFSVETMGERLRALYKRVLSESPGPAGRRP